MPPEHYEAAVARAVERIRAGALEKIVLAREVQVHAPRAARRRGASSACCARRFPSCFVLLRRRAATPPFVGATPGAAGPPRGPARVARSRSPARPAAAPTRPSTTTSASSCCARTRTASEQAIVARRIERALRPHSVWVDGAPTSRWSCGSRTSSTSRRRSARSSPAGRRDRARRAAAPDAGRRRRAARGRGAADPGARGPRPRLVRRAASAGRTPTRTASSASRCAARCCAGAVARCYAGVGVVRDSDPAAELAETEVKLGALLPVLAG